MEIVELTPELHAAYDEAIQGFSIATVYHTRAWSSFLTEMFGVELATLIALEGERVIAVLPLAVRKRTLGPPRLIALPFSHRVPPLGDRGALASLLTHAAELAADRFDTHVELHEKVADTNKICSSQFVNTVITLPSSETALRKQVRENTWQQVRQGLKNRDLRVITASGNEHYAAMDRIMAINRRFLGSATYPRGFFRCFGHHLGAMSRVELCLFREKPIALFVASAFGSNAIYHYGASETAPEYRRLRPNNLLYWSALTRAVQDGITQFDLGTSLPSQAGLIRYKEGWGGTTQPLYYSIVGVHTNHARNSITQDSTLAKVSGLVLRHLPLPAFRAITPLLLREFG